MVSAIDYGMYAGLESLRETSNLWYVRLTDGTEKYGNVTIPTTGESISAGTQVISAAASSEYQTLLVDTLRKYTKDN